MFAAKFNSDFCSQVMAMATTTGLLLEDQKPDMVAPPGVARWIDLFSGAYSELLQAVQGDIVYKSQAQEIFSQAVSAAIITYRTTIGDQSCFVSDESCQTEDLQSTTKRPQVDEIIDLPVKRLREETLADAESFLEVTMTEPNAPEELLDDDDDEVEREVKKEKPLHECGECGAEFRRRYDLQRHALRHLPKEKRASAAKESHSCKVCEMNFSKLTLLRRHQKEAHPPTKEELTCPHCQAQMRNALALKYHLQIHSPIKPFLCQDCGRAFLRRRPLQDHIAALHSNKRQFPCELKGCEKSYVRAVDLENHMRSHSGERPFVCEFCGNGYTYKCHLTEHLRQHTGDKPYVCDEPDCGKAFARLSKLKRHQRVHTKEKPFMCSICGNAYRQPWGLQCHQKEKHGRVVKEDLRERGAKRAVMPMSLQDGLTQHL